MKEQLNIYKKIVIKQLQRQKESSEILYNIKTELCQLYKRYLDKKFQSYISGNFIFHHSNVKVSYNLLSGVLSVGLYFIINKTKGDTPEETKAIRSAKGFISNNTYFPDKHKKFIHWHSRNISLDHLYDHSFNFTIIINNKDVYFTLKEES